MLPFSQLPKPLPHVDLYLLLAFAGGESTHYPLKARMYNYSLGAIQPADSVVYRAVAKLHESGLVDLIRTEAGQAGRIPKEFYEISGYGKIRLEEEILRLDHAVKIARHAGVMNDKTPTDIQRLRLELLDWSER